ncbi:alpha/beta fold hydrolase [Streptomyces gobiensis]|uniref:alpha/beta fold hydrolase n=1 Tax=Streptomyces gobiensis TaxID=2875706 RepID=UPI001E64CD49|nr:hypothetical protein [Streptomyces gobiensis]UGY94619.1 hypothetical protein test1122_24720 [Streptomyces gobiensis]
MRPGTERLATVLLVYAADLPGFRRGDRPRRALSVGEPAEALRGWIDAASVPRPALVANSFGRQVSVDLTGRRRESVPQESETPMRSPCYVAECNPRWALAAAHTHLHRADPFDETDLMRRIPDRCRRA